MTNISEEKLKEIVNVFNKHKEKAANKLNLSKETFNRYLRKARQIGLIEEETEVFKPPKILLLDIENTPSLAAVWGVNKQFVDTSSIVQEWYMLSWAARWLHSADMYSDVVTSEESMEQDDSRIVQSLWEFIDHADIIIGHNVEMFDTTKFNTRAIIHGLKPPSSYVLIDTLKAARKHFLFTSNKLDYLCQQLSIPRKIQTEGMGLWLKCMNGDPLALSLMQEYNKNDVVITEDLYTALMPYMKTHPNLGLFYKSEIEICYKCGGTDLEWLDSFYHTTVNKFSEYRCKACNSLGRSRHSAIHRDDKKHITAPVAR